MTLITTKKEKKHSPEFGWLNIITFHILGIKFWTEYHFAEDVVPTQEKHTSHDLEEMALYAEWRERMKAMRLDDETFIQILNTRF